MFVEQSKFNSKHMHTYLYIAHFIKKLVALLMLTMVAGVAFGQIYTEGDGSPGNPYHVTTA